MRRGSLAAVLLLLLLPAVTRAAPGDIDEHFSRDGFALLGSSANPVNAYDMTVDAKGRMVFVGETWHTSEVGGGKLVFGRLLPNGRPDRSFGDRGLVMATMTATRDPVTARLVDQVVTDENDRILIAGQVGAAGFVARFLAKGQLDPSFGQGGVTLIQPQGSANDLSDLSMTRAGRIAFVGTETPVSGPTQVLVGELENDGTLATGFANEGTYRGGFEPGVPAAGRRVLETRDGGLIVAGGSGPALAALAVGANGTPRSSYGQGGSVVWGVGLGRVPLGGGVTDEVASIALDEDEGLVVVGNACEIGSRFGYCRGLISRVRADGAVDRSFADNGFWLGEEEVPLVDVGMDRSGRILVGATDEIEGRAFPQNDNLTAYRLTADGDFDTAFAGDGRASIDHKFGLESAVSLIVDARGRILVGGTGSTDLVSYLGDRFSVARYTAKKGPRDGDGDQVLDRDDRCEFNFARRPDGCPLVGRTAALERGVRQTFRVTVDSRLDECIEKMPVSLLAARPGPDKRLARGKTDIVGHWGADVPESAGRVYAYVPTARVPHAAACSQARSRPQDANRPERG